jgi:DNA-binding transcriptional ArsR family regulator
VPQLWSAIADPSRRRVLDLVVSNGAVSASWLAGRVPFSRQAVSKHLVVLERFDTSRYSARSPRPPASTT